MYALMIGYYRFINVIFDLIILFQDDLIEVMDSSLLSDDSRNDYNSSVTANEAKNRYECPICFCFLQDPVITRCGHRFCEICLSNCLQ